MEIPAASVTFLDPCFAIIVHMGDKMNIETSFAPRYGTHGLLLAGNGFL